MAVTGSTSPVRQQPGVTPGNIAVWASDGVLGDDAQYPATAFARTTSQPTNQTGTTSATAVMMGLAGTITPKSTGNVVITICGDLINSGVAGVATLQASHGTGTAPANGAALAGTQDGTIINYVAATAAGKVPWSVTVYLAGLTVGTAYWIDVALSASANTSTIQHVNIVSIEV